MIYELVLRNSDCSLEFVFSLLLLQPFNFSPVSFACNFQDWGCVILREIDFLLKLCWSIPCLHPLWKVHTCFLSFRIFQQLGLALKKKVVLKFSLYSIYFLPFRIVEQLCACPENRVCPEIFQVGRLPPPQPPSRPPASYTYDCSRTQTGTPCQSWRKQFLHPHTHTAGKQVAFNACLTSIERLKMLCPLHCTNVCITSLLVQLVEHAW